MRNLAILAVFTASIALGAEFFYISLSGTNTQTATVGAKATRFAIQCTTPVRYKLSNGSASTVAATDPLIATGDPYIIDKSTGYDRINVAHQDLATSISCSIFRRVP